MIDHRGHIDRVYHLYVSVCVLLICQYLGMSCHTDCIDMYFHQCETSCVFSSSGSLRTTCDRYCIDIVFDPMCVFKFLLIENNLSQ